MAVTGAAASGDERSSSSGSRLVNIRSSEPRNTRTRGCPRRLHEQATLLERDGHSDRGVDDLLRDLLGKALLLSSVRRYSPTTRPAKDGSIGRTARSSGGARGLPVRAICRAGAPTLFASKSSLLESAITVSRTSRAREVRREAVDPAGVGDDLVPLERRAVHAVGVGALLHREHAPPGLLTEHGRARERTVPRDHIVHRGAQRAGREGQRHVGHQRSLDHVVVVDRVADRRVRRVGGVDRAGVGHSGGAEHVLLQVPLVRRTGDSLDDHTEEEIAGVRVRELGAGLELERPVLEVRDDLRLGVWLVAHLHQLGVGGVAGDPRGVREQLVNRHMAPALGRLRHVLADGVLDAELALLHEREDRGGRELLGERADAEARGGRRGEASLAVRLAVCFSEDDLSVAHEGEVP